MPTAVLSPVVANATPKPTACVTLACPHKAVWYILHPRLDNNEVPACNRCIAQLKRDGLQESSIIRLVNP